MTFKKEDKYLVIKLDDIKNFLSKEMILQLESICQIIREGRHELGKKDNSYVVVNEDENYADRVWKFIELSIDSPDKLKRVLKAVDTEIGK